ncbi:MAG: hypothetical protein FWG02_04830 [Holophagaceae bacterium]|nr:hypothetical protein [Holophagaceae bacterium]
MKITWMLLSFITSVLLAMPMLAQTDMEHSLTRHKGNKIVLLGDWKSDDVARWRKLIDSDGIYEHGFTLLDHATLTNATGFYNSLNRVTNIEAFEQWFKQQYSLSSTDKWVALNLEHNLIVAGTKVPDAKELDQMLDQRGIKSPLRQLRDFLLENPDHQDAKTDLLREVRRRAIHVMPVDISEDLDDETDLRTWAILAAETDKIFRGSWLGIDPVFFLPQKDQPEQYSKLMKAVFQRHIVQIESAIRRDPLDNATWDLWAWMARSLPDYNGHAFIDSIECFDFVARNLYPAPVNVSAWILADAVAKKNWDTAIRYGKSATRFSIDRSATEIQYSWAPPGVARMIAVNSGTNIEGYPLKSNLLYVEALLRTSNIEVANRFFDEKVAHVRNSREGSPSAFAEVARMAGMEELAKQWEQGQRMGKEPFVIPEMGLGKHFLYLHVDKNSDFRQKFNVITNRLWPLLFPTGTAGRKDINTLGWKAEDPEKWGIFSPDGRLLEEGTVVPDKETLETIYKRNGIENPIEYFRAYLAEHGNVPGIELWTAFNLINHNVRASNFDENPEPSLEDATWGETAKYLRNALNSPEVLFNLPSVGTVSEGAKSELLKSLSKQYLTAIESLLEKRPTLERLWMHWLFWRKLEGEERSVLTLLERIKCSPLYKKFSVIPSRVMDTYYAECRKNEDWTKLIELLKNSWDRELVMKNVPESNDNKQELPEFMKKFNETRSAGFGNGVGIPLIEAYLHANRANEADNIFNEWLKHGKFANISTIVELAKSLGYERLAKDWETKARDEK